MNKLLVILTIVFYSFHAYSCDCALRKSVKENFATIPFIIEVKVIKASPDHKLNQTQIYLDSLSAKHQKRIYGQITTNQYILAVNQIFKGEVVTDTIVLRTAPH